MRLLTLFFVSVFAFNLFAQNEILTYEKTGEKILVGVCNESDFTDNPDFSKWFELGYKNYKPKFFNFEFDKERISKLKIKIVLGTWCPDSRREFPRFLKILDSLAFPRENLQIICVDRNKHALHGEASGLRIIRVPTFIFFDGEHEIGRIVETPKGETLEDDLEAILLSHAPQAETKKDTTK
jgi:thiol-disulfide isomerase/thioredoxin